MRYLLIIISFVSCVLASCEKVIDVHLGNTEKKYVIEASITDQAGQCQVVITQTKNFDENNTFPPVSGAIVSITDNSTGVTTSLNETSPGTYRHESLVAISGKTYTLKVSVNGETFTASSTIPSLVNMDTIYTTLDSWFDGEDIILANIEYQDPAGIDNNYRFVRYLNGVKTKRLFTNSDDLTDGRYTTTKLFVGDNDEEEDKLKSGDIVKIEMLCIDEAVYKYWYSMEQSSTGETESATPANPVTNISGGALGYFSAHTYQTKTMTVP